MYYKGEKMKSTKTVCAIFLSFVIFGSSIVFGETFTKSIQVTYRNISILVNGKQVPSEQEPFIYHGRTFVPLRIVGEALNKKVEWDNEKNRVNITDKPSELSQNFLCFPVHKVGERLEAYPYALTIKKVYQGKIGKDGVNFKEDQIFIDLTVENKSTRVKYLQGSRPFTIWDEYGNLLASVNERYLESLCFPPNFVSKDKAYLYCKLSENLKNKKLTLVFYPVDAQNGDRPDELNVFFAFDLEKIE